MKNNKDSLITFEVHNGDVKVGVRDMSLLHHPLTVKIGE